MTHTVDISSDSSGESVLVSKPFQSIDGSNRWFKAWLRMVEGKVKIEAEESSRFLFFFYKPWNATAKSRAMASEIEKKINGHV